VPDWLYTFSGYAMQGAKSLLRTFFGVAGDEIALKEKSWPIVHEHLSSAVLDLIGHLLVVGSDRDAEATPASARVCLTDECVSCVGIAMFVIVVVVFEVAIM
jgi:hypothetical protein